MKKFLSQNGAWIGFLFLALAFTVLTNGDFLSARNITNLARQATINGVLACGMTVIILLGGIDLSIGSIVALCSVVIGVTQVNWGWGNLGSLGFLESCGVSLLVGTTIGAVNGTLIAILGLAPFVITLGVMVVARGLSLIISNGSSITPMGDTLNELASGYLSPTMALSVACFFILSFVLLNWSEEKKSQASLLVVPALFIGFLSFSFWRYRGLPLLVVVLFFVFLIIWLLLRKTVFGRSVYAIGSNETAALWAGVPIKKVKILTYSLMGMLSGLGALLLTARLNGADPNAGQLFELDAIAAVVIGGTSLKGGTGTVMGSLVGAFTIATLNNGMDLLSVSSFYQMVFKGIIIILAVCMDRSQKS